MSQPSPMDPQTKSTITAFTSEELREQLRNWLDGEKVFQAWHANVTPVTVLIEIAYADEQGVISKQQFIHTNARTLRELMNQSKTSIQQQELFK